MRIHFFTVNDIQDYRKVYPENSMVKEAFKEAHPRTIEELDQAYFYRLANNPFINADNMLESEIYGETDIPGLRLDFNYGLRLDVPEGNFRVRISDLDTEKICFDKFISGGRILSLEKYFIRWRVEIFLNDEKIFEHTLSLEGQPVVIKCISEALGDTLALAPYFSEFQRIHHCKLAVFMPEYLRELMAWLYPDIPLLDEMNLENYATYYPTMFQATPFIPMVPIDTRQVSMTQVGGMLLGINYIPPKVEFRPTAPPVTDAPYVCIGIQARDARKGWLYPNGWDIVVDYLKRLGYRVFCIDKNAEQTGDGLTIRKPEGAEDFTGNRALMERANMLYHAEFFIGLGSGLAWLADMVGCPVVMIAGFSQDWCEFYTPYRVANRKVCNGCFNDLRVPYLASVCPWHKDTPRKLECQKKISPRMVINAIERLIIDRNLTPPALKNF